VGSTIGNAGGPTLAPHRHGEQTGIVRTTRALIVVGIICLLVAGSSLFMGFVEGPWLTLAALTLGTIMLVTALLRARGETGRSVTHDPARGERLVRVAAFGLAGLGVVAVLVALVVAVGEARGHAFLHLFTGVLCFGLFVGLAPWHPPAGTAVATLRGLTLSLLAVATFGSFMESLGGAGYDAANDGHRIEALTVVHSLAAPFAAPLALAVPLGIITGIVVLIGRVKGRGRTVRI